MGVVGAKLLVVAVGHVQAHDGGLHQRGRRANGVEIVVLLDLVHDLLGGNGVAETPAGDGVGLAEGGAGHGALPHAGQGVHVGVLVALVDDVLIDLVHDGVDVVLDAQVCDELQLFLGEDLAAGVGGVADQDGLGALLEGVLQDVGDRS